MKNVAKTGKFPRVRSREEQLVFHKRILNIERSQICQQLENVEYSLHSSINQ